MGVLVALPLAIPANPNSCARDDCSMYVLVILCEVYIKLVHLLHTQSQQLHLYMLYLERPNLASSIVDSIAHNICP